MESEYKVGLFAFGLSVLLLISIVVDGAIKDVRQKECVIKSQEIGKFSVLEIKELCGGK